MVNPAYLVFRVYPETDNNEVDMYFNFITKTVSSSGAEILGSVKSTDIGVFEIGSIPFSTLILKWVSGSVAAEDYWNSKEHKNIFDKLTINCRNDIIAFIADGLPDDGLVNDPIPTIASYESRIFKFNENKTLLVIEGKVSDQKTIEKYREILFEIMIEQKSYYIVLTSSEGINLLHGKWNEDIFAISKWQSMQSINEFWYCDKYQNVAIPIRTGAGNFSVTGFN
jgi:uncharacterized protein (DUF1330 family)